KKEREDKDEESKSKINKINSEVVKGGDVKNIRNILLIGCTGNGKSTIANVLVNKNGDFKEIFKEGEFFSSKTKNVQSMQFEYNRITYKIVDTVGINDTNYLQDQVLEELAKVCWYIKEEISQVFFVTRGRFTKEEKMAYNLLSEVIFDKNISKYITIIRTGFDSFEDPNKCKEDREILIKNNTEINDLIDANIKIIHVNNPSINITGGPTTALLNECNKKIREESRKRLLELLEKCGDVYKSQNFYRKFCEELGKMIEARKEIIEELIKTKEKLSNYIFKGETIENFSTASQLASGVVAPFFPYISSITASIEIVDRSYKGLRERYERKSLNEFNNKIDEDKKIQEEYQMNNKIKKLTEELKEMEKSKCDHEKKFESWNERRKELNSKIEMVDDIYYDAVE
ncbi:5603_t:CDS:2, partial [Dentiscutata heterogama]